MSQRLILENISKKFARVQALSKVNLECKKGEILVLLGENGAGKSTLVSLLAGQIKQDEGSIFQKDENTSLPLKSFQDKIGVVFQHSTLVPEFTVLENLLLSPKYTLAWQQSIKEDAQKHYENLSLFLKIDINSSTYVQDLSLGEQQLIELIRALFFEQEYLILDELTAHLTIQEVRKLEKSMKILAKKGYTIIFITHKLEEALDFADKIVVLQKGEKTLELNKDNFLNDVIKAKEEIYKAMFSLDFIQEKHFSLPQIDYTQASFFEVENISTEKQNFIGIENISFKIHKGEILGIAGFDGQGQKYLAKALAGEIKINNGAIYLDKDNISDTSQSTRQKHGIFYVSADRLGEAIAKEETIAINLQLKNLEDRNYFSKLKIFWLNLQNYARKIMQEFSIAAKHIDSPIAVLSGGNIQKVIVSRELENAHARLIILHQPSYGLDLKTKEFLHDKFIQEAALGKAFILISSDIDELLKLSHSIAVIKQGKIQEFFENNAMAHEKITNSLIRR